MGTAGCDHDQGGALAQCKVHTLGTQEAKSGPGQETQPQDGPQGPCQLPVQRPGETWAKACLQRGCSAAPATSAPCVHSRRHRPRAGLDSRCPMGWVVTYAAEREAGS